MNINIFTDLFSSNNLYLHCLMIQNIQSISQKIYIYTWKKLYVWLTETGQKKESLNIIQWDYGAIFPQFSIKTLTRKKIPPIPTEKKSGLIWELKELISVIKEPKLSKKDVEKMDSEPQVCAWFFFVIEVLFYSI